MSDEYAARIREALTTIQENWDDALEPTPGGSSGGKQANKRGSRPPLPLESLSVRHEVWEFLASWCRYVREWFPDDVAMSTDGPGMADWLHGHAGVMATDEVIQDETPALERLAKALHLAANPPAPDPSVYLGPSPVAAFGILVRHGEEARCTQSGEVHPHWWWWAKREGHDPEEAVDRAGCAVAIGASAGQVRQLIHRGQLAESAGRIFVWEATYHAKVAGWPKRRVDVEVA